MTGIFKQFNVSRYTSRVFH